MTKTALPSRSVHNRRKTNRREKVVFRDETRTVFIYWTVFLSGKVENVMRRKKVKSLTVQIKEVDCSLPPLKVQGELIYIFAIDSKCKLTFDEKENTVEIQDLQ